LRNVALLAPYMHDGSLATLEVVIDYYDRGGNDKKGKSPFVLKIGLTREEKKDLLAFLKTLNGPVAAAAPPSR
jgi:cytochrome c peroxidase